MILRSLLVVCLAATAAQAAPFYAAAGSTDITPDLKNETTWMAGYGAAGRHPTAVHDPLFARALVVSDGKKTIAMVAVDNIGMFREDVEAIRRNIDWTHSDKYLFVAGVHTHSGPDTEGLWGHYPGVSGVNEHYRARLLKSISELVMELSTHLQEARLTAASKNIDPRGICRDIRDPVVIDPELDALQFQRKDGSAIGTLVRYSCHPEVMGRANTELTPDFPGALCARIEEKTSGPCVYFSGAIGGMMTPDVDHSQGVLKEFAEVKRVGEALADLALGALKTDALKDASGPVSFESKFVRLPVENSRYLLFLPNLVFGHRLFDKDGAPLGAESPYLLAMRQLLLFPLPEAARPRIETEVSLLRIGPVKILGIPGEPFPELTIGGYDGRYRFGWPLIGPANPNPPDLSKAPKGPYLREQLNAKVGLIIGLANDHIGYLMPDYDFQAKQNRSMDPQPPGTHYEETNSIGPSATDIILKACGELLK